MTSRDNIGVAAGTAVATAGTTLGVLVAGAGVGVAVVSAGLVIPLYIGGHLAWRAVQARLLRDRPLILDDQSSATEIVQSLDALLYRARDLPHAVLVRIDRIVALIKETLRRADRLPAGSADAYALVRTATNYLPEAVETYLRLPSRFAAEEVLSGGKTSEQVLIDQLQLLSDKMDDVYDAVCHADADALMIHGRFLEEKFGRGLNL